MVTMASAYMPFKPPQGSWWWALWAMHNPPPTWWIGTHLLGSKSQHILYIVGLHKAGLYLILINLVAVSLFVCYQCFPTISTNSGSVNCVYGVVLTIKLALICVCIALLVSAYKKHEKVNYFEVNQVELSQFDVDSISGALNYTMSVTVSLGPNHEKVYYEDLRAWAYYQGHNFSSLSLLPMWDSPTKTIRLVFRGQHKLVLAGDGMKRYEEDAAAGWFSMAVTLSYSGFRAGNERSDRLMATNEETTVVIKATGYNNVIKGIVTFELKDVPLLSDATKSGTILNGGSVLGGAAAAAS